jgi:putative sterol carrier protein
LRFLSQEWAEAMRERLNADQEFRSGVAGKQARIQQVVTAAGGEHRYWIRIEGGGIDLGVGDIEEPDATVTQPYEVAAGMMRREMSPVTAFMMGKLRVDGDLTLLLGLQEPFSRLPEVAASLDVEY